MLNVITAVRNAMCDAGVDLLDAGASEPTLSIETSADAVLLVIGLNATAAFGDAGASVDGQAEAAAPTTGTGTDWTDFSQVPSAAGVAAKAKWKDGDGTTLYESSVGTIVAAAAEVRFTTLTFDTAVPVTTTVAPLITAPATS